MSAKGGGSRKPKTKKVTGLGIGAKKGEDFASWYTQVITRAEMIDYYDISGCYILRPWAFEIWEQIQAFFDGEIKALGVRNAYFPVFVSRAALEAEKDHVEGFAPEVAWVTRSGSSELAEPIAIRPTSETIMYPAFARWISSHRDLPLRLNQWTNVVRWEFKMPTPFLRTREFLWQEGHSAFATREEADREVLDILDRYARVYEELLAVPVIKGRKSEKEKFAGGLYTTTVEAFIPTNGRAIQGATSHCLGQNFAKMFGITFHGGDDGDGMASKLVWQNSWGLTTRTIGVMIMVHGDDNGLVLPPRVAPIQVVVIGIVHASDDKETVDGVDGACRAVTDHLCAAGVRAHYDDRAHQTSGWKYAHWEQKGVPLRLEIGPRDLAKGCASSVRRDDRKRADISIASLLTPSPPATPASTSTPSVISAPPAPRAESATASAVVELLTQIQADMLDRARRERDSRIAMVTEWKDFVPALDKGMMVLTPWCQDGDSEEWVKEATRNTGAEDGEAEETAATKLSGSAKTLCIPFEQPPMPEGQLCFTGNGKPATAWTLWGRSY